MKKNERGKNKVKRKRVGKERERKYGIEKRRLEEVEKENEKENRAGCVCLQLNQVIRDGSVLISGSFTIYILRPYIIPF